jgi:predicted TIM-barrel fold metal-dependent hydrolase
MTNRQARNLRLLLAGLCVLFLLFVASRVYSRLTGVAAVESDAYVRQAVTEHQIVDVHEHIQSIEQVPTMLAAMDQAGIGKVCLMGSSWFTITLDPSVGFTRYDENNDQLIKISEAYPGRFEAWPTMNPKDPQKLEKFKALVARGAKGLKLYLGHGYVIKKTNQYMFHTIAMDDPQMDPVYAYLQENFIPVVLHVNPSPVAPGFAEEFVSVLKKYPDMKVVCPHYMLSSIKETRLEELLDTFPNLYTDVSFGHDDFLIPGLERISKNPVKFRHLFHTYSTRFMFSTDLVMTDDARKTQQWIYERFKTYLDTLTQSTYQTPLIPGVTLNGLALAPDLLERIFHKNYEDLMAAKPHGTEITRQINWKRMGVKQTLRKPGDTFAPPPPKKKTGGE